MNQRMDRIRVLSIFKNLKRNAIRCSNIGLYGSCLKYTQAACWWAYYFNVSFGDEELEKVSFALSKTIKQVPTYIPDATRIVFFDSFAWDNHGLTQQYIRALMKMQYSILFLTDSTSDNPNSQDIYKELNAYPKAKIVNIPCIILGAKRAQYIYDEIINFQASKVFMHLMPDAVETIMAMQALPNSVTRYQINLTDHTFWIGASALDYSFEFRPMGMKASEKYRKIDSNRLLLCPYYPIIKDIAFKGFPFSKKEGDVLLFSGGAAYKFIDDKATFAKIIKRILDENPNVIWVHAGAGQEAIEEMLYSVMDETYKKRIYLIGHRDDIAQIVNAIDVYVSSYPMAGGLMSLYAALYKKPILVLKGEYSSVDEIVGQVCPINLSYDSIDDLCHEAGRLISDVNYRLLRGKQINECIVDKTKFNDIFNKLCLNHINVLPYELPLDAQLPSMEEKYYYENQTRECTNKIVNDLKWRAIFLSTIFIRPVCIYYKKKIIRKIKKLMRI